MQVAVLNETIKELTLKNGLRVKIYDNPKLTKFYANYTTFFGSNDLEYYNHDNKLVRLPDGIAHFLEHVMFASESGDVFNEFSRNSASANAYTSYNQTSYLFSSANNFLENLEILIRMVQTQYFTTEVVEKERGIIAEEILMYHQMPEWRLRNYMYENICAKTNYKIDIAGTVETINQITPEMLIDIFNNFYIPQNQLLVLSGNFSNIDVETELEKMQLIESKATLELKKEIEIIEKQKETFNSYEMDNNEMTYADIVYKFEPILDPKMNMKAYFSITVFLNAYLSSLNDEYNEALENKLINKNLGTSTSFGKDIAYMSFQIIGDDVLETSREFVESLVKFEKIDKKMIKLGLRKLIATEIRIADDKIDFVESILSCELDGITISEYYEILFAMSEEEIITILKDLFTNSEKFTVVLK